MQLSNADERKYLQIACRELPRPSASTVKKAKMRNEEEGVDVSVLDASLNLPGTLGRDTSVNSATSPARSMSNVDSLKHLENHDFERENKFLGHQPHTF